MLEGKLDLNKIITYLLIMLLGGSEAWQYFDFQDKIGRDSKKHTTEVFDSRVDSLITALNGKNYAQGMLEAGAMEFKDLPQEQARVYMTKVFKVADEAIKNDSSWRYEQRPFLHYLMEHKQELEHLFTYDYLVPMRNKETDNLYFNWLDGIYPITDKDGVKSWRDRSDDKHYLQSISTIKDR